MQHSVTIYRIIRAKFGICNFSQSPDIGKKSDWSISDFRISGQFLINKNCHNYGTSNDIDMKLGPATKIYKRNMEASKKKKKKDKYVMLKNCAATVIFPIYDQFGAIQTAASGCRVCETYIFINGKLLS